MSQYDVGYYEGGQTGVVVVDMPLEDLTKLPKDEHKKHVVAEFKVRGVLSAKVADVWAKKIAEQLNQFENANAAVAKML